MLSKIYEFSRLLTVEEALEQRNLTKKPTHQEYIEISIATEALRDEVPVQSPLIRYYRRVQS